MRRRLAVGGGMAGERIPLMATVPDAVLDQTEVPETS
jgi:hypothetical protein